MKNLLILGAGGFGHMIQETAKILGYEEVVFLDDAVIGTDIIGKCCDYKAFLEKYDTAVAGLGDNGMRLYWTEQYSSVCSSKPECKDWRGKFYYAECGSEHKYCD